MANPHLDPRMYLHFPKIMNEEVKSIFMILSDISYRLCYIATKETYVGKKYLIQAFLFYLSEWSVVGLLKCCKFGSFRESLFSRNFAVS